MQNITNDELSAAIDRLVDLIAAHHKANNELIDIDGVSALLGISKCTATRMDTSRLLPKPIMIGKSKRWLKKTIYAWLEAGAPVRNKWEALQKQIDNQQQKK